MIGSLSAVDRFNQVEPINRVAVSTARPPAPGRYEFHRRRSGHVRARSTPCRSSRRDFAQAGHRARSHVDRHQQEPPPPALGARPSGRVRRPHRPSHLAPASLGGGAVLLAGRVEPRLGRARGRRTRAQSPRRVDDPCRRRPPSQSRGAARRTAASDEWLRATRAVEPRPTPGPLRGCACWTLPPTPAPISTLSAILADACGSRRTTAGGCSRRSGTADESHAVTGSILCCATSPRGPVSVLEHGYLTRVERPHGLPRGRRQRPAVSTRGRVFRDVDYEQYRLDRRARRARLPQVGRGAAIETWTAISMRPSNAAKPSASATARCSIADAAPRADRQHPAGPRMARITHGLPLVRLIGSTRLNQSTALARNQ